MTVSQGDVFWVDIPAIQAEGSEQYGRRPFVVMSRDAVNRALKTVVVVPLTTYNDSVTDEMLAKEPVFRIVIPAEQITRDVTCNSKLSLSVAKTDQVRVIDKTRLGQKIGKLSKTATISVGAGLAFLFDYR